jgi:hypothetical protein
MWKVACLILLLPGLTLAQSASEPPTPKAVDPLAGVTFWPKAKSGWPTSAVSMTRFGVSNLPVRRFAFGGAPTSANRMERAPATPEILRCAIPLLKLRIPADRDYAIQRSAPIPIDGTFVTKPSVPSCE